MDKGSALNVSDIFKSVVTLYMCIKTQFNTVLILVIINFFQFTHLKITVAFRVNLKSKYSVRKLIDVIKALFVYTWCRTPSKRCFSTCYGQLIWDQVSSIIALRASTSLKLFCHALTGPPLEVVPPYCPRHHRQFPRTVHGAVDGPRGTAHSTLHSPLLPYSVPPTELLESAVMHF